MYHNHICIIHLYICIIFVSYLFHLEPLRLGVKENAADLNQGCEDEGKQPGNALKTKGFLKTRKDQSCNVSNFLHRLHEMGKEVKI